LTPGDDQIVVSCRIQDRKTMSTPTPTQIRNMQAVQDHYAALNRGDIVAALQAFASDVESVEPDHYNYGGTTQGLEGVTAIFQNGRSTWAEGGCEPQKLIPAGDKVVAFCKVHVRLNGQTEWLDGAVTDVITFRDGAIIHRRTFDEPKEALTFAGLSEADTVSE
jgi:ketosteroid isomerase-like protein